MGFLPDMCDYFVDEVMNDPDYLRDIAYMHGGKGNSFKSLVNKIFDEKSKRGLLLECEFKWLNSKNEYIDVREIDDNYYYNLRSFWLKNDVLKHYQVTSIDDARKLYKIINNKNYNILNMNEGYVVKSIINDSLFINDKIDIKELKSFKIFGTDVSVFKVNERENMRELLFDNRVIKYDIFDVCHINTFIVLDEDKDTFRNQVIERVYEMRNDFPELKYIDEAIEMQTSNNLSIKD